MYREIGKNDLTPIDVVVKNPDTNVACIKARFSLAIKVESLVPDVGSEANMQQVASNETGETKPIEDLRIVLGYLPLDQVISVEDSCPDWSQPKPANSNETNPTSSTPAPVDTKDEDTKQEPEDLEMIVTFECGKLAFTFKRNETCDYLSSIKGLVKLGKCLLKVYLIGSFSGSLANNKMFLFHSQIQIGKWFESLSLRGQC